MSGSLQKYNYQFLPPGHFRVLELASPVQGQENNQLAWSLRIVPFPDSGKNELAYDALSYTWGENITTYQLICDGQVLQIRQNLYEALPYLARRSSGLPLWIDAVCINQSDEVEKIGQISLMSKIYQRAACVWVWLGVGEEPGCSEAVESILPRIGEIAGAIEEMPESRIFQLSDFDLPAESSPAWDAFLKIVKNPWNGRLWVVQEASLARDLKFLFGRSIIPEKILETALGSMSSLRSLRYENGRDLKIFRQLDSGSMTLFHCRDVHQDRKGRNKIDRHCVANTVGTIVGFTAAHQCSDPRDRVLALLGFMDNYENEIVYDSSTTVVDLYVQFLHFIFHGKDPTWNVWGSIFARAVDPTKDPKFPSWCPDLHSQRSPNGSRSTRGMDHSNTYGASTKQRANRQGRTARELILRGCVFDTIEKIGPVLNSMTAEHRSTKGGWLMWLLDLCEWESCAFELASDAFNHSPDSASETSAQCESRCFTKEDYWNALVGNLSGYYERGLTIDEFLEFKLFLSDFSEMAHRIGIHR